MVGAEKSALFLDFTFYLMKKKSSKFFVVVSKTDCNNEKSLAIGVK